MSTSISDQPHAEHVEFVGDAMVVHLRDGRAISVPLRWFPRLMGAPPEQRASWRLIGQGVGLRWDELDEDISVRGLLMPE